MQSTYLDFTTWLAKNPGNHNVGILLDQAGFDTRPSSEFSKLTLLNSHVATLLKPPYTPAESTKLEKKAEFIYVYKGKLPEKPKFIVDYVFFYSLQIGQNKVIALYYDENRREKIAFKRDKWIIPVYCTHEKQLVNAWLIMT